MYSFVCYSSPIIQPGPHNSHKYTSTQIHKYTNKQIHKYSLFMYFFVCYSYTIIEPGPHNSHKYTNTVRMYSFVLCVLVVLCLIVFVFKMKHTYMSVFWPLLCSSDIVFKYICLHNETHIYVCFLATLVFWWYCV